MCPRLQKYVARMTPAELKETEQFPWHIKVRDGNMPFEYVLAKLKLLGTDKGYWSIGEGALPHEANATIRSLMPQLQAFTNAPSRGRSLLLQSFPTEDNGWHHVPANQIPTLDHKRLKDLGITKMDLNHPLKSWSQYYAWRKLPLESPVALVMHWPLTIYHMLNICLNDVPQSVPDRAVASLLIHLLGVEVELDLLPLYGELALLYPGRKIHIHMTGQSIPNLYKEAKQDALIRRGIVYSYTAPEFLGGGSVEITLDVANSEWTPTETPHFLMACNAGLATYPNWQTSVLPKCILVGMPFISSEYTEESLDIANKDLIPKMIDQHRTQMIRERKEKVGRDDTRFLDPRDIQVSLNPFRRPGQREHQISQQPNYVNGFISYMPPS